MTQGNEISGRPYKCCALACSGAAQSRGTHLKLKGNVAPLMVSRGQRTRLVGSSMMGLKLMSRYLTWWINADLWLYDKGVGVVMHLRFGKWTPKSSGNLVMLFDSSERKLQPRHDSTCIDAVNKRR